MKKGGEGPHNWGGAASELDDEIAAQQDAQRDAEAAIAEGDEHPGVQSFEQRSGEVSTSPDTGSLSEDYANKEGGLLARMQTDPNTMDLNEIARSSGSVSHPTADTVSSGTDPSLVR